MSLNNREVCLNLIIIFNSIDNWNNNISLTSKPFTKSYKIENNIYLNSCFVTADITLILQKLIMWNLWSFKYFNKFIELLFDFKFYSFNINLSITLF